MTEKSQILKYYIRVCEFSPDVDIVPQRYAYFFLKKMLVNCIQKNFVGKNRMLKDHILN